MVVPMLRPDVFGALAATPATRSSRPATCPSSRRSRALLRDEFDGSWDTFFERAPAADPPKPSWIALLEVYGYAACYSPDPDRPGRALLPFDVTRAPDRRRLGAVARS